jgi:hypothetical protein
MVLGWTALISNYSWKITFHTMSSEAIFVWRNEKNRFTMGNREM